MPRKTPNLVTLVASKQLPNQAFSASYSPHYHNAGHSEAKLLFLLIALSADANGVFPWADDKGAAIERLEAQSELTQTAVRCIVRDLRELGLIVGDQGDEYLQINRTALRKLTGALPAFHSLLAEAYVEPRQVS